MKTIKAIVLLTALLTGTIGMKAQKAEWKEMKDFHGVMSKTFHPSEDGNLQPLKENAADLYAKAKAWEQSPVPSGYKPAETKKILHQLVAKTKEIDAAVTANKSDKELTKLITSAHDIFHEVAEKCRKGEGEK